MIEEIILTAIIGILTTTGVLLRKEISEWIVKIMKQVFTKKPDPFNQMTIEHYNMIYTKLIESANIFNADSIAIFQFHNGEVFTSQNHIWKISCSHEYCKPGIRSSINDFQNVPAASFALLLSLAERNELPQGCIFSRCDSKCAETCQNKYKGVFMFELEKISGIFEKDVRLLHGYKKSFVIPIHRNNNIIGIVEVLYRSETPEMNISDDIPQEMCRLARIMSGCL